MQALCLRALILRLLCPLITMSLRSVFFYVYILCLYCNLGVFTHMSTLTMRVRLFLFVFFKQKRLYVFYCWLEGISVLTCLMVMDRIFILVRICARIIVMLPLWMRTRTACFFFLHCNSYTSTFACAKVCFTRPTVATASCTYTCSSTTSCVYTCVRVALMIMCERYITL